MSRSIPDNEAMDATTPHGKAMLQMAAVFAELERGKPGFSA